jgi:hypothetical protein
MRRAVNENPVVQVVVVGILLVLAAFLLMTRVFTSSEEPAPTTDSTETAADPTSSATEALAPAESTGAPTADSAAAGSAGVAEVATGAFQAGPGLPAPLVAAYDRGDTVVVLVTRRGGIDDGHVKVAVNSLRARGDVAVFKTVAKHVAKYSRVAEGVDLNRVPAVIVVSPKAATKGGLPTAAVAYGYRSLESIQQAVRDAGYKGPDLPYHPK